MLVAFGAVTLLVGRQEGHSAHKKDGDAHWRHLENTIEAYIAVAVQFYVKLL